MSAPECPHCSARRNDEDTVSYTQWLQFLSEVEVQRPPEATAAFLSYLEETLRQLQVHSAATLSRRDEPTTSRTPSGVQLGLGLG